MKLITRLRLLRPSTGPRSCSLAAGEQPQRKGTCRLLSDVLLPICDNSHDFGIRDKYRCEN